MQNGNPVWSIRPMKYQNVEKENKTDENGSRIAFAARDRP